MVRDSGMKVVVDVEQLKIGMYVCELDRPWRETPFLFQGFEIRDQDQIASLRQYCRSVTILKGEGDRQIGFSHRQVPAGAQPAWSPAHHRSLRVEQEVYKINNHPNAHSIYQDVTSMAEEVDTVRDTFIETRLLIQEILHDAKLGRSLSLSATKKVVHNMVESVIRNPDALMCFAQLKRKDEYTALHSLRVCILALAFGRQLGLPRDQLEVLGLGALLHDVGKVKVPEAILAKPDALTPQEYDIMKQHVAWGAEILYQTRQIPGAALDVVTGHHERHDGSGYLRGLRGDQIGDFGMIGAIVDHYDAITSDRAYRGAVSAHGVLMKMYEWRNTLFSAPLVEKFIQCLGVYPIGSIVELNTGDIGVVAAINRQQRLKPQVMMVYDAERRPYQDMPITNIINCRTADDRPWEIERVLEPDSIDIDPAQILRMAVAL
jgi:putative nucleotidyltransferase with HDIG domain